MIKSLSYENKNIGWRLSDLQLEPLTLLVGVSGVGKTKILLAINGLGRIASGSNFPARAWNVVFTVDGGEEYSWEGEFSKVEGGVAQDSRMYYEEDSDAEKGKIVFERLTGPNGEIFSRSDDEIIFNGAVMPKLPSEKSLIATLKEEEQIKPVFDCLTKIVLSQGSRTAAAENYMFCVYQPHRLLKTFKTLDDVYKSSLRVLERLYIAQHIDRSAFDRVKAQFIEIFPNVEDLRLDRATNAEGDDDEIYGSDALIQVKERGVEDWIRPEHLSSGMLRTLVHLSEIILLPKDSILLIDEFENSLGVNCIDVVTEELLHASHRMQFIITSHHPYVINSVGVDYWRVVSRKGTDVFTTPASQLGIGKSSHDSFLQLLNARGYNQGVLFP